MRIDFHSHILPGIDDGAANIEESLKLIKILSDAGVEKIVLTPHFYRESETIDSFLLRRENAYKKLKDAVKDIEGCPELLLGAEVYFHPSLCNDSKFERLCIENTGYVLLELPFEHFYDNFYSLYVNFVNRCSQKIILVHIERYLSFGNTMDDILHIINSGNVLCQMNCTSIAESGLFKKKLMLNMISNGLIHVIGTDTHNTKTRPPLYKKAESVIVNKCGEKIFGQICSNGEKILADCPIEEII